MRTPSNFQVTPAKKQTRPSDKTLSKMESAAARIEAAEAQADANDLVLQELLRGVEAATRGQVGAHLGPMTREERRKLLLGEGN
jgi:hypothetical protein